mgnify:CR=1 FL=1
MSLSNILSEIEENKEESPSLSDILKERLRDIDQASQEAIYFDTENVDLSQCPRWKPSYKGKILEHLARGKSVESFCGKVGVTLKEFDRWKQKHPEIQRLVEIGDNLSLGKFENMAELVATGVVKGNAAMLWNLMKNRHPDKFKDKVDVAHSGDMTFIFDTGIKRDVENESFSEKPDFKEVHYQSDQDFDSFDDSDIL